MQKFALAIVLGFVFIGAPLYSQSGNSDFRSFVMLIKKEYGLDHELINGTQYYNRHSRSQGDPYFINPVYRVGSLTQEGRTYRDVDLRFDIHAQHVELRYRNFSGGGNEIVTVVDKVEAFTMGTYQFRKMAMEDGEELFYQVLSTPCFTCYIHWEKELLPLNGSFTYTNQFSEAKKSLWLDLNGKLDAFSSRKDFYGLFPDASQKEIKRLMARNQFKFRTAPVDEIILNLEAVCRILEGPEE